MKCTTCNGSGKVSENSFAASGYMNQAGMGLRVCPTCGGSGNTPGTGFSVQPGGRGRGAYDTLVNFECFVIGVIAAVLLWQYHVAAGIIGFIVGWLGGLLLFGMFPKTFTAVFTLIWVSIAIGIAESLSGGDWRWILLAATIAAFGSFRAHMRTLKTFRDAE